MIDVHSHILHGLDDGAASLDISLAMVRLAAEWGTTDIVASPHANQEYKFDPELVEDRLEELRAAAGASAPRIYYGCDFHLSYDNIQDAVAHPARYTIDHGRYLLVEFSDLVIFPNTTEIFARLLDAGMIPVITHPERNTLLQQRLPKLREWSEMGCLLQVTAQSFNGRFGRRAERFSKVLLEENLIHVVASDAHDTKHRPPDLGEAYDWLAKERSEALAETLCVRNPGAVLRSEPLPEPALADAEVAASRKWYQFWK